MGLPQSLNRYGQGIIVWKFSQQKLIVMTNPGYDNAEWLYKSLDAFYAVLNKCGNVYGNGSVMLWLGHWQCREVLLYCWYLQETFADWDILQTVAGSKNNPTSYKVFHKTLCAFHLAISQSVMYWGFDSLTIFNSPFFWLLKIVQRLSNNWSR